MPCSQLDAHIHTQGDRGFFDHMAAWEQCKMACEMDAKCNYFHWGSSRSDRRCHLCTQSRGFAADRTDYWGPAVCEGNARVEISLTQAVAEMAAFCTAPVEFNNLKHLTHARALHTKLKHRDELFEENAGFAQELTDAADIAARALEKITSGGCAAQPTSCNSGVIAVHLLRVILVLVDNSGSRAFRDSPERQVVNIFVTPYSSINFNHSLLNSCKISVNYSRAGKKFSTNTACSSPMRSG